MADHVAVRGEGLDKTYDPRGVRDYTRHIVAGQVNYSKFDLPQLASVPDKQAERSQLGLDVRVLQVQPVLEPPYFVPY